MQSKTYRLKEFIDPADGRSLVIDASAGLSLGALAGLEYFSEAVEAVLPLVDGLVTSPGMAGKLSGRTRQEATLLVRADWTNAIRKTDFVLPPETTNHLTLLGPSDALDLGASAIVLYFLLGHEEQIEASCLRTTVQFALQGSQAGMPLVIDVQPIGPRVVLRSKAIALGVSYALEGGADGIAIPWPGPETLQTVLTMAAEVPVWVKPDELDQAERVLAEALALGAAGLWLDERIFAQPDPPGIISGLAAQVHQSIAAGPS
ncbi:MAG: hypothetical protein P8Y14_19320 [Anaerolineales bacterium]